MPPIVRKVLDRGMNIIYGVEETGLGGLSMGLISLKAEDRFGETLNCREAVLVLLHGTIRLRGEGFDHGVVSARETVFGGAPIAAYCPPGMYSIKAKTDCALAVFRYGLDKKNKGAAPMLISPDNAAGNEGAGQVYRRTLCDLSGSVSGLQVGETIYASGAPAGAPTPLLNDVADSKSCGLMLFCFEDGEGEASFNLNGEALDIHDNDVTVMPAGSKGEYIPGDTPSYCLWAVANS